MSDNRSEEKVIIIGNSPSILLQEYGELIDSYDVVIRVNRCVTKGFEKYIGKKIDIWATTHTYNYPLTSVDFVPENYSEIKYLWKRTPNVELKLPEDFPKVKKFIMYKNKYFNKHYEYLLEEFDIKKHEPDTGLLTILTSLKFYKDVTIHGFTFYTEQEEHSVTGYYRESEVDEDGKHPEDKLWKRQIDTGFGSIDEGKKKQELLKELINNGLDRNMISISESRIKGYKIKESVPVKILNEDELGEMNL
jgi:hypothetical protein